MFGKFVMFGGSTAEFSSTMLIRLFPDINVYHNMANVNKIAHKIISPIFEAVKFVPSWCINDCTHFICRKQKLK